MSNEWEELQARLLGIPAKWLGTSADYTFLQFLPDYYLDGSSFATWYDDIVDTTQGFQSFSTKQQQVIYFLLEPPGSEKITGDYTSGINYRVSFSDVINFTFNEKIQSSNDVGKITFLQSTLVNPVEEGKAFIPDIFGVGASEKGDVIIDSDNLVNEGSNIDLGESGFWVLLHELGHAFGGLLDAKDTSLASTEFNNQKYTMMSYNPYGAMISVGNAVSGSTVYASGLQLLDIAALQDTYGTVNTATRSGDTAYALGQGLGFFGATPTNAFLYTIWDGGGNDTINVSGFGSLGFGAEIDLREGHFSSIGVDGNKNPWAWDQFAITGVDPDPGNVAIAYGTEIENAIGTQHADHLIGNAKGNILNGARGNDVLEGGAGADTLDGGLGNDTADYSGDAAAGGTGGITATLNNTGAGTATDGFGNTDTLSGIENIVMGAGNDRLTLAYTDTSFSAQTRSYIRVFDGGDGSDTIFMDSRIPSPTGTGSFPMVYDGASGQFWNYFGTQATALQNFENFSILNLQDVILLPDLSKEGLTDFNPGFRYGDFSASPFGLVFDRDNPGQQATVSGGGFTQQLTVFPLIGSNHGDIFELGFHHGANITTGTGDDIVRMTPFDVRPDPTSTLTYTGGNDTYYLTAPIGKIFLADTIKKQDVNIHLLGDASAPGTRMDVRLDIAGHGVLNLFYEDIYPYSYQVVLASGDAYQISIRPPRPDEPQEFGIREIVETTAPVFGVTTPWLTGSWDDDTWVGKDNVAETYFGRGGDDTLSGRGGNDSIYGGFGNDILTGGAGDDFIDGGDGGDTYIFNRGDGNDTIVDSGASGTDVLRLGDGITVADVRVVRLGGDDIRLEIASGVRIVGQNAGGGSGIEVLQFADGFQVRLADFGDWISVPDSNPGMFGTSRNDIIIGGDADNEIFGFGGNDIIYGGDGSDFLLGEDGDDIIYGSDGSDGVLDGGNGSDHLYGGNGDDFIAGGEGNDFLYGGKGDDILIGEGGADALYGEDGNDSLQGSEQDDLMYGGAGADDFFGDLGDDFLFGGLDNDSYFFQSNTGHDTIEEEGGSFDSIQMESGATLADLTFTRSGDDLVISGLNSSFTIKGQYSGDASKVVERLNIFSAGAFSFTVDLRTISTTSNHSPLAQDDVFITAHNVPVSGNVLADNGNGTDSDADGNALSVVAATVTTAGGATVFLLSSGDFTYNQPSGFSGMDSFSYTLSDGHGGTDIGTVAITVADAPVNTAPVAQNDSFTLNEDTILNVNLLVNDADPDNGDTISVIPAFFVTAAGATVSLTADGNLFYTPALNFFGNDMFSYTIQDSHGLTDTADVVVNVLPVNDDPVAQDDSFSLNEDTVLNGNVLANDADIDNVMLNAVAGTFTTLHGGTVAINSDGTFTYTPLLNFNGVDSFDYTLADPDGASDTATVSLTINPVNDAPDAKDDLFDGAFGQKITGYLLTNNGNGADFDIDGDSLSVEAQKFTTANGGHVSVNTDGSFTYMPAFYFFGTDSFSYAIFDGHGGTDTAVANLNISAPQGAVFGTNGRDVITGGRADNVIFGLDGNDMLNGNGGKDILIGGTGNDTLHGGNGNDVLYGGRGADTLFGGNGKDKFIIDSTDAVDTIGDFKKGDDAIDISALLEQFDPLTDAIRDFVRLTEQNGQTTIAIDQDGGRNSFAAAVIVQGNIAGSTLTDLINNGSLIV